MRYHDPKQFETVHGRPVPSYRYVIDTQTDLADSSSSGPLIWCLWLVDIVQSLHFDLSINLFSSRELWTSMPGSSADFQDVYRSMLDDRTPREYSIETEFSQEDNLLLLMAVMADLLHVRHSLGQVVQPAATRGQNPFAPFSARMELDHIEAQLSLALDKWHRWFHAQASPENLALYHYVRMYLSFHQLLSLPFIAGYTGRQPPMALSSIESISDEAVRQAWRVLDSAATWSQQSLTDHLCPIWLPIAVFHAGLVVWAKYSLCGAQLGAGYGSARVLLAFKIELDGMPWPCCVEMAATLTRLIAASPSSQG